MQTSHWQKKILSLLVVRTLLLSTFVHAAGMDSPAAIGGSGAARAVHRGGFGGGYSGFQRVLEHSLGLTPEQRESVHGLLAQQHEALQSLRTEMQPKYAAIQEQTDSKIRALLNPDQQKKFDMLVAHQKEARAARHRRPS